MATATNEQEAQPKLIFPIKKTDKDNKSTNSNSASASSSGSDSIIKINTKCANCGKPQNTILKCSRCNCVVYCNSACQRNHWDKHKIDCKTPSATTVAKIAGGVEVKIKIKKIIHVLLDTSGSMAGSGARQILALIKIFIDNPDYDLKITFFGGQSRTVIVHSPLTACNAYNADGCTYTDEIRNLFACWRNMKIYPEFLVFIGDGVFSDNNFMKHISDYSDVFTKLINFVLAFPCGVSEKIQNTLLTELTQVICNTHLATSVYIKCFNADCPVSALLDLINSANLTENALILPEGYTRVGTLFGFMTGMTASELAAQIKLNIKEYPTLIEDLLKFMQNVIKTVPEVLIVNKVYIILHKLLHILCKEVYSEWIQMHQRSLSNTSSQYKALSDLIKQSFRDMTLIISMFNKIKHLIIGFAQFKGINQPTADDLLAMLRSKGMGIEEMLKKLFKIVTVVPISEKSAREYTLEYILDHPELCGMPVLSSDATPEECRLALRLCFLQIDVLPLSEHIGWILSMILLTSNYILHEEIINMVRKSFLGDDAYTRRMIGISHDNKHEWVDVLCSMKLSISLSRALRQFSRQMFSPESLAQLASIINNIHALATGQHIVVNAIRNIIKSKLEATNTIENTVPIGEGRPDNKFYIGDIILIRFIGDPAPNLPGCVVVIAVNEITGTVILEFLDKERDGKDIHTLRNTFVLPRNYVKLYTRAPLALQNELNKRLIQMVSEMGSSYGAPYDDTIYNKNFAIVKAILYTKGTRIVTTTYSAQIPNANIIDILGLGGMPADILSIIYNNANLNKEQLISIVRFLTTPQIKQDEDAIHSFICKDGNFIISPELCETIRSTFNKILQSITGDCTTTLRTLGDVWCGVCLSDNHYTNSARYGCGEHHWACIDCMQGFIEQGKLEHGTPKFIEMSCYTCPECKIPLTSNPNIDPRVIDLINLYPGGFPANTRFRPCKECDTIFPQELACGGEDTRLNTLCDTCLPPAPDSNIRACPGCFTTIIDHDACAHITCPVSECNTHYCFGCLYIFTEEQIQRLRPVWWECFGNCDDEKVNKKLNLDNDNDNDNDSDDDS